MEKITSVAGLKNSIQALEIEHAAKGVIFKEQFFLAYESLNPVNLVKNYFKNAVNTPGLTTSILGAVVAMATGYFSNKMVVGAKGGALKKFLGLLMQYGVTNFVTKNPDALKSFGQFIFQILSGKKENTTDNS